MGELDERRDAAQLGWSEGLLRVFDEERLGFVRLAYLLMGDEAAAEEIVQDAFVSTALSASAIESLRAYVRRAVVNGCRSWGRHQRVVERHRSTQSPESASLDADELWDALGTLSARRRSAIVLRFYEDLTHGEIAKLLECSPVTVRTSIHRGLRQLKQEIGQ